MRRLRSTLWSRNVRFTLGSRTDKWVRVFWSLERHALRASVVSPTFVPSLSESGPHQLEGSRRLADMVLQVAASVRSADLGHSVSVGVTRRRGPPKVNAWKVGETLKRMAGTTGFEPATSDVTGRRSNQLNYVPEVC